jgi:hypothetical protein
MNEVANIEYFVFSNGILQDIQFLSEQKNIIDDELVPSETKPVKSIERINSLLFEEKLKLYTHLFILFFSLSVFFSTLYNTWFSVSISKIFHFLTGFTFLKYSFLALTGFLILAFKKFIPNNQDITVDVGTLLLVASINLPILIMVIYNLNKLFKVSNLSELEYYTLYLSGINDEENQNKTHSLNFQEKPRTSFLKKIYNLTFGNSVLKHFTLIIITGLLIGNLLYVPLFSLQKHYQSEFGILLGIGLVLLSVFYIRNYYLIGLNQKFSKKGNLFVSISFLQYRFLKNTFFLVFSIIGVVVFVTLLYLILISNSEFLKDQSIIDRTIHL